MSPHDIITQLIAQHRQRVVVEICKDDATFLLRRDRLVPFIQDLDDIQIVHHQHLVAVRCLDRNIFRFGCCVENKNRRVPSGLNLSLHAWRKLIASHKNPLRSDRELSLESNLRKLSNTTGIARETMRLENAFSCRIVSSVGSSSDK